MTVQDIAAWLGGELTGSGEATIRAVAKIEEAEAGTLTFLANPKYERHLSATRASAILIARTLDLSRHTLPPALSVIRVDDPYASFLKVLARLTPAIDPFPDGIHPTAVVAPDAVLEEGVALGAHVVIGAGATIGGGTRIADGCVVMARAKVGRDCRFYPNVVVYHQCEVGDRAILHAGAVIGSDGFGFAPKPDGTYEKIPQLGIVVLEDDVELGANTTIDRATIGETRICRGVKLDNLVHIAHNVLVDQHTVVAAQTGIAGSVRIGKNCMFGGQVGIAGHLSIADRTIIEAQSGVTKTIEEPGTVMFGYPAKDARRARRIEAVIRSLPELSREFEQLKRELAALKEQISGHHTT